MNRRRHLPDALALAVLLTGALVAVPAAVRESAQASVDVSHYGAYVTSGAISATVTTTATQPVSPTYTLTPTASATAPITFTPGVTATIRPTRTVAPTATATITATPTVSASFSTPTPTATITPTLAPEWGVDALCRCHVPPLPPGSPECERLKAEYVRDVLAAWATQTTLARGTDTPTPTPSDTPVPTATPTLTPIPTDEPTPSPAPTWTPRVIVVTATPVLFPCRLTAERCGTRIFVPFNGKGRRR